jgi:hypothetical protein
MFHWIITFAGNGFLRTNDIQRVLQGGVSSQILFLHCATRGANETGLTLLAVQQSPSTAEILLESKAIDPNMKDADGATAIERTTSKKFSNCLIEAGWSSKEREIHLLEHQSSCYGVPGTCPVVGCNMILSRRRL